MDQTEPTASATYADVDRSRDPAEAAAWMDRLAGWPAFKAYKGHMAELLRATADGPLLDVGCGVGNDVRALGPRAIGLDPSRTMLDQAVARGGTFVAGSVERMPFAPGTFAGVRADRVLQHVADPDAAAIELARVVRPGGLVVVADPDQGTLRIDGPEPSITEVVRQFRAEKAIRNGHLAGRMTAVLEAAGCTAVERRSWTMELTDPNDAFGLPTWGHYLHTLGLLTEVDAERWQASVAFAAAKHQFRYRVDLVVTWGHRS
jgi:ubiquinone/menaquinone biosynthesis C-methylase UbiE